MEKVKAKKHLGQHFLKDESIAKDIADTLNLKGYNDVLEIGPGMGVLTKYLLDKSVDTYVIEIDTESVTYLDENYPKLKDRIISKDFLKYNINDIFEGRQFAIIGNFPYNISTQIVFRALEYRSQIPEFAGMFQKEVAQRICEKKGTKAYGILSVLVQAFYDAEYLFTVDENVFIPPPKVKSGVLRLRRKEDYSLPCSEKLFFTVVKTAFQQRRKTLRNSLKTLNLSDSLREDEVFNLRPEQLNVEQFIELTQKIEADGV
ncbi:MAG TPA: 16S rRNA (adenine(1518)-N(6)/adenine(1519)-N(6))-dimethyltransferase RsmA [Flavobacterium sp.]|jgi:16S rRNA (adenine1518-N6/adenine1519-N6)-dimethyltransferase|uniref:16S rRNA (adenine(1518)-N(6)/adenine(1519)-N(6))- dimethyltransferase RsmA n=1 Tax=Flavobacterium sp. TaxID=239 RepID=UPI001B5CD169|nr:16S rRNA (adenine(1518)-N(6)/adenine(1519)-N(6))-dimethyltransferase RsmA [Flavobacterium sp.]MBP6145662.1 16S rRNA (adenine(1518)-N(6)/adenine(1519)-N(6))-dimethyltransferase RsmA [Flavobacterium sp.]MBP7181891.1 16S rRNA (adenine(1518)-N(6)/adenine(1519)-N(6))-dimethyltransferase RsmA [Flavobacterium sp.]MBP7318583.1 16S rRNA (adenine(1518)-N(6)/adenine(1519)-N(6))-dimethyltransferase RsmA [Flavobacterium sp.]MBP8886757.1 16S rRNA (adenine(1518)-N(6)/adenine(1519)-N(6))-dimethyltransferase